MPPKTRYEGLDGLRGVAALLVVAFHLETHAGHWPALHGYVAVDLFFALSGFVIAHSYENRLASGMTLRAFAWQRLIRLYPLMLLGGAMGLAVAVFRGEQGLIPAAVAEALWIPLLTNAVGLYPLNGVQWSLLFEVIANALHVTVLRRLNVRALALIAILAGVALVVSDLYGEASGGNRGVSFAAGLIRVAFSYPLGVLIYRLHRDGRLPALKIPFPLIAAALISGTFLAMRHKGFHQMGDAALVIVVLPTLLVASIHARPSRWLPMKLLGDLSFPIYAIHAPMIALWEALKLPLTYATEAELAVGIVATAWIVEKGDAAIRDWLKRLSVRPVPVAVG